MVPVLYKIDLVLSKVVALELGLENPEIHGQACGRLKFLHCNARVDTIDI